MALPGVWRVEIRSPWFDFPHWNGLGDAERTFAPHWLPPSLWHRVHKFLLVEHWYSPKIACFSAWVRSFWLRDGWQYFCSHISHLSSQVCRCRCLLWCTCYTHLLISCHWLFFCLLLLFRRDDAFQHPNLGDVPRNVCVCACVFQSGLPLLAAVRFIFRGFQNQGCLFVGGLVKRMRANPRAAKRIQAHHSPRAAGTCQFLAGIAAVGFIWRLGQQRPLVKFRPWFMETSSPKVG